MAGKKLNDGTKIESVDNPIKAYFESEGDYEISCSAYENKKGFISSVLRKKGKLVATATPVLITVTPSRTGGGSSSTPSFNIIILEPSLTGSRSIPSGTNFEIRCKINITTPPITVNECRFTVTDSIGTVIRSEIITADPAKPNEYSFFLSINNPTSTPQEVNIEYKIETTAGTKTENQKVLIEPATTGTALFKVDDVILSPVTVESGDYVTYTTKVTAIGRDITISECKFIGTTTSGSTIAYTARPKKGSLPLLIKTGTSAEFTITEPSPTGITTAAAYKFLAIATDNTGKNLRSKNATDLTITPKASGITHKFTVSDVVITPPEVKSEEEVVFKTTVTALEDVTISEVVFSPRGGTFNAKESLPIKISKGKSKEFTRLVKTLKVTKEEIYETIAIVKDDKDVEERSKNKTILKVIPKTSKTAPKFTVSKLIATPSEPHSGEELVLTAQITALEETEIRSCFVNHKISGTSGLGGTLNPKESIPITLRKGESHTFTWTYNPVTKTETIYEFNAIATDDKGHIVTSPEKTLVKVSPGTAGTISITIEEPGDIIELENTFNIRAKVTSPAELVDTSCDFSLYELPKSGKKIFIHKKKGVVRKDTAKQETYTAIDKISLSKDVEEQDYEIECIITTGIPQEVFKVTKKMTARKQIDETPPIPPQLIIDSPEDKTRIQNDESITLQAHVSGIKKEDIDHYIWELKEKDETKTTPIEDRTKDVQSSKINCKLSKPGEYKLKCIVYNNKGQPLAISEYKTVYVRSVSTTEPNELITDLDKIVAAMKEEKELVKEIGSRVQKDREMTNAKDYIDELDGAATFEESTIQPMLTRFEDNIKSKIAATIISETKGAHLLTVLNALKSHDNSRGTNNWKKFQHWMRQAIAFTEKKNYSNLTQTLNTLTSDAQEKDKSGVSWPVGMLPRRIELLNKTLRATILMEEKQVQPDIQPPNPPTESERKNADQDVIPKLELTTSKQAVQENEEFEVKAELKNIKENSQIAGFTWEEIGSDGLTIKSTGKSGETISMSKIHKTRFSRAGEYKIRCQSMVDKKGIEETIKITVTQGQQTDEEIERILKDAEQQEPHADVWTRDAKLTKDSQPVHTVLGYKHKSKPGYIVIPFNPYSYYLHNLAEWFDGIPKELYYDRGKNLIKIISLPYTETKIERNTKVIDILNKGQVIVTEKGKEQIEINKEIWAGPPLVTEKELRASNWKLYENFDWSCFASPDGKWICVVPSKRVHELKKQGKATMMPNLGGMWETVNNDEDNYLAAYFWRGEIPEFDPSKPGILQDITRIEKFRHAKQK